VNTSCDKVLIPPILIEQHDSKFLCSKIESYRKIAIEDLKAVHTIRKKTKEMWETSGFDISQQ
jgi:hypothetical protein